MRFRDFIARAGSRLLLPAIFAAAVLILFQWALPAATLHAQQANTGTEAEVYEFAPGDVVNIYVYEEPEISQTVAVRRDGRISLPLVGDVLAAGETPEGLSGKIAGKLEKYIEAPNVTVMLAESRDRVYYVLGQVGAPGEYSLSRSVTVIQALARAGGFLEWAKKSRIMVVRGSGASGKIFYFDYDRFLDKPESEKNINVEPGDTIVVP
jgi:polysaccharide export outer membrane protein